MSIHQFVLGASARRVVIGTLGVLGTIALVAAASPGAAARTAAAEFVVVVHEDNPLTTIEREHLSKLFLKRINKWPGGRPVEPMDLTPTAVSRVAFTKAVHKKSVAAIRAFWQQQIFSGRDIPPPEKGTEEQVVEYIRFHPDAVGYVSPDAVLGAGVKSVTIGNAP